MLAEKIFNTDMQASRDLMSRAVEIADEIAWTAPDALYLVEWLTSRGKVIYGIELIHEKAGKLQWIASSQALSEAPEVNAREASQFIREYCDFEAHPRNLFSMTWSDLPVRETAANRVI